VLDSEKNVLTIICIWCLTVKIDMVFDNDGNSVRQ
jgi:hypothetical protein